MNLVDSSAWLSYLAGDRNAGAFSRAIEDTARLLVPTVVLLEVFKAVARQRGEDEAIEIVAHMQQGQVVALDTELALNAAAVGLEHALPLADSIIYATARRFDATLWTQDRDFEGLPGVRYLA
jgi:toxin FitB